MALPPIPHEVHDYDHARHEGFVVDSFRGWAHRPRGEVVRWLRDPGTRCVVASGPGYPDDLYAWAAAHHDAVLLAYVKPELDLRRHGLMTSLLLACGIDVSRPTPCLYWPRTAAAIAAAGKCRIYFDPYRRARARAAFIEQEREELAA